MMAKGGDDQRELTDCESAKAAVMTAQLRVKEAEQAYALARRQAGKAKLELDRARDAERQAAQRVALLQEAELAAAGVNAPLPLPSPGCIISGTVRMDGDTTFRTHDPHVIHWAGCSGCDAHRGIASPVGPIKHYRRDPDDPAKHRVCMLHPSGLLVPLDTAETSA
jgi:hypothetical protein